MLTKSLNHKPGKAINALNLFYLKKCIICPQVHLLDHPINLNVNCPKKRLTFLGFQNCRTNFKTDFKFMNKNDFWINGLHTNGP